ncbi:MAG: hypothetical protein ING30_12220 [Burkholderiales bacterium]|nr:hypothetical protein [Burkholderiales bacterium]
MNNRADVKPEAWNVNDPEAFRVAFADGANHLRWLLLYLRRPGATTKGKLSTKALQPSIDKGLKKLENSDYDLIAKRLRAVHALKGRTKDLDHRRHLNPRPTISTSELNIFFGSKAPPLADDVVYVLVEILIQEKYLALTDGKSAPGGDALTALHQALNAFLDVADETKQDFPLEVCGHWVVFRPSQHAPTFFSKAHVVIEEQGAADKDGIRTLVMRERHVHHKHKGGKAIGETFSENYVGVLSKKAGVPFAILCRHQDHGDMKSASVRGVNRGAPRFSLFPTLIYGGNRLVAMSGITLSPFAGGFPSALPVCLERLENAPNDEDLGVFPPDNTTQVPPEVQARLRQLP